MNYTQLTQEQRYQIAVLKKADHTQVDIARLIGVNKSTISRELSRNTGKRGYRPKQAHRLALERRQQKVKQSITAEDWQRINALLRQEWSPEEIGERLRMEGLRFVSHEWIYQHVYADKKNGGDLHKFLRRQKQRRKRYGSNNRRGKIPDRIGIRPLLIRKHASEIGRAIPSLVKATKGPSCRWWNVNPSTPCWVRSNARKPIW